MERAMTEDEHALYTAGALSQNDKIEALQEEIAELKRSREGWQLGTLLFGITLFAILFPSFFEALGLYGIGGGILLTVVGAIVIGIAEQRRKRRR
jgi:hypothetical protein